MGFKNLFVQEVEDDDIDLSQLSNGLAPSLEAEPINVEVPEINSVEIGDEFVEGVYEANHLKDTSKSIFQVSILRNTLPKEMLNEVKKTTVTSIMSSFNLTVDEVVEDGEKRVKVLDAALNSTVSGLEDQNNSLFSEIEELKAQINQKETEIAANKDIIKNASEAANEEISRINELINFIK